MVVWRKDALGEGTASAKSWLAQAAARKLMLKERGTHGVSWGTSFQPRPW